MQLILIFQFVQTFWLVKKNNGVVYRQHKWPMICYFIGMQVYLFMYSALFLAGMFLVNENDDFIHTPSSLNPVDLLNQCLNPQVFRAARVIRIFYMCIIEFPVLDIFNSFIILYVKSSSDVVVSFSKLDNLLVVSAFQRFKDNELNLNKESALLENFLDTRHQNNLLVTSIVTTEYSSDIPEDSQGSRGSNSDFRSRGPSDFRSRMQSDHRSDLRSGGHTSDNRSRSDLRFTDLGRISQPVSSDYSINTNSNVVSSLLEQSSIEKD